MAPGKHKEFALRGVFVGAELAYLRLTTKCYNFRVVALEPGDTDGQNYPGGLSSSLHSRLPKAQHGGGSLLLKDPEARPRRLSVLDRPFTALRISDLTSSQG
jgi:hypothetical protein